LPPPPLIGIKMRFGLFVKSLAGNVIVQPVAVAGGAGFGATVTPVMGVCSVQSD
jgi:hypothetical protein